MNFHTKASTFLKTAVILCTLALTACGPAPRNTASNEIDLDSQYYDNKFGNQVTRIALKQIGTHYRYGGYTPGGFDCSGLVYYSYGKMGIQLPRSASSQAHALRPIRISQLRPGDLVFFKIYGNRISHVGIYYHDGLFIHAPKSGKRVSITSMNTPYWRARYYGARRVQDQTMLTSRETVRNW